VGTEPLVLGGVLADADDVVDADCAAVVLEPLPLPHAATRAELPIAITIADTRRAEDALNKTAASLSARQDSGTIAESWRSRRNPPCARAVWNAG
jgi:hypothetical protein